jgi:hypothetical protein
MGANMTYEQGVRIASRVLACYLFFVAISAVLELPREITTFANAVGVVNSPRSTEAAHRVDVLNLNTHIGNLAGTILRFCIWGSVGLAFYRCGPAIQRYFGKASPSPQASRTENSPSASLDPAAGI